MDTFDCWLSRDNETTRLHLGIFKGKTRADAETAAAVKHKKMLAKLQCGGYHIEAERTNTPTTKKSRRLHVVTRDLPL